MLCEVEFENWQCYRGHHLLKLEPKAYAITARYEIDPGRSNWGGKSALPEGIDFAMTGRLSKHRNWDANGWITKGEKKGFFQIKLEDGTIMRRERARGSRTDVTLKLPGQKEATQEDAESLFLKHVAFDADDAKTIVYFEQDMMNRIIRTEPEKRFDIVRGWLGLQKGEQAEDAAGEIVKKRIREVAKLRARRASVVTMMPAELEDAPSLVELQRERDSLAGKIEALEEKREVVTSFTNDQKLVTQYDALAEEGKTAAEAVETIAEDLEERLTSTEDYVAEQQSAYLTAKQEAAQKKKTSLGQFDGKCPVADIECPATKRINSDITSSKASYDAAKLKEERAEKAWQTAKTGAIGVREEAKEAIVKRARLKQLRERAIDMLPEVREARKRVKAAKKYKTDDVEEIDEELKTLRSTMRVVDETIAETKANERQRTTLQAQLAEIETQLAEEEKQAALATAGRATFRAAQRRMSEHALDKIGLGANKMLREAAVDLGIEIQWEREGKLLAKSCEMCGASFPTSTKVKRCETCDAERGMNISQKLEFLLTDRSGAADDFAGLAMQLAAGSYLLRHRQSSWAMAMVDEPFSKMDRTIRRTAAKQLLQLLGSAAYRQLLVISHSQDTVDLYPGRISITVARDGTRSIDIT